MSSEICFCIHVQLHCSSEMSKVECATSFASVRPLLSLSLSLSLSGYQHVLNWTTSFASVRPLVALTGYQHVLY